MSISVGRLKRKTYQRGTRSDEERKAKKEKKKSRGRLDLTEVRKVYRGGYIAKQVRRIGHSMFKEY
jgi:hypothetical protein